MTDDAPWLAANDQYLADALADLRERLQRAAQSPDAPATPPVPAAATTLMESAPAVNAPIGQRHSWAARMFGSHPRRAPLPRTSTHGVDTPPAAQPLGAEVPDDDTATVARPVHVRAPVVVAVHRHGAGHALPGVVRAGATRSGQAVSDFRAGLRRARRTELGCVVAGAAAALLAPARHPSAGRAAVDRCGAQRRRARGEFRQGYELPGRPAASAAHRAAAGELAAVATRARRAVAGRPAPGAGGRRTAGGATPRQRQHQQAGDRADDRATGAQRNRPSG